MHPIRDGNGPNVTTFSAQVHDCPMLFALLKMANGQAGEFVPTESASEEQGQQCPIALALHLLLARCLPECLALLGGQPVAKPDSQLLDALDSPYSSSQICAEEPAVCCLVRKTAHGSETKVDRTRSEVAGFQMHSVPDDHGFAERQPRLGTIPIHEFVNRVPVAALSVRAGEAVEDGGLRDLEVWQSQNRLSEAALFLTTWLSFHHLWPPTPQVHPPTCAARAESGWRVILPTCRQAISGLPSADWIAKNLLAAAPQMP